MVYRAQLNANNRRSKIRIYMKESGMTQKEFAKCAGITPTTISRVMTGEMQSGSIAYTASQRYMSRNE